MLARLETLDGCVGIVELDPRDPIPMVIDRPIRTPGRTAGPDEVTARARLRRYRYAGRNCGTAMYREEP